MRLPTIDELMEAAQPGVDRALRAVPVLPVQGKTEAARRALELALAGGVGARLYPALSRWFVDGGGWFFILLVVFLVLIVMD